MIGLERRWKNITIAILPIMLLSSMTSCSLAQKELTNEDVMTSKHATAVRMDSHTFLNHSGILIGTDGVQFDTRDSDGRTTPYDEKYISIAGIVERTLEDSIIVKIESELYGVEYSTDITVYPIITNHIDTFSRDDIIWVTGLYSYSSLSISDAILNRDDIFGRSYSECISEAVEIDKRDFLYNENNAT